MSLPLISVIIPNYNHSKFLSQRLNSLVNQSYKNLEIIIIDDCSTDNSRYIIDKFKCDFNTKKIFNKQNLGPFKSHNLGATLAKGEYILFAESDDFCDSNLIEVLVDNLISDSSLGVSFCKSKIIDENGNSIRDDYEYREKKFREKCIESTKILAHDMREYLLISNVIPNMSAAMIKRDLFLSINGLNTSYRLCADWDLWLRLSEVTDFYYSTNVLNYFRDH